VPQVEVAADPYKDAIAQPILVDELDAKPLIPEFFGYRLATQELSRNQRWGTKSP
jgi:hypothetical protein